MNDIMKTGDILDIQSIQKQIIDEIDILTSMVRSKITDTHRTSISSLITSRVHDRDQLGEIIKLKNEEDIKSSFVWLMYLKFNYSAIDPEGDLK
jgi:hypothetical protein